MGYANTANVQFIVDPKVLFHGWLIYSYLEMCKLIKCKWLPGKCADCSHLVMKEKIDVK